MTASEPFTHHRSLGGFDIWVSPSPLCQKRVEYKADKIEAAQNSPIPSISEERLKLRAIRWARLPHIALRDTTPATGDMEHGRASHSQGLIAVLKNLPKMVDDFVGLRKLSVGILEE
ncbi:hypothetical protein N7453_002362 [Penicillium expansum]|nr:hypothetical protein N7453_002362 [Penicillium expansum]